MNSTTKDDLRCSVDYDDWVDMADSEFVDYIEGRRSVGFVFEHPEIGLHGLKFDQADGELRAVMFQEVDGE